jgi:hypothetical protein
MSLIGIHADDEVDDPTQYPVAYSKVIRFVLEIFVQTAVAVPVNEGLLKTVLAALPLDPDTGAMESILRLVVRLVEDERLRAVQVPGLIAIAELLMMKKPALDRYRLPPELLAEAKTTLQKLVRPNRALERQITNTFQGLRPKLNKFSSLLK